MNLRIFLPAVLTTLFIGGEVLPAHTTTNYTYKPNEYVVVENGLSPNKQFSIAAHGEGELGMENFHLYLMDARSGKKIGSLEEISESLDTGAEAFHAKWAPDSQHVAIRYRVERHVGSLVVFRIQNHRAYLVSGPDLLKVATPNVTPAALSNWLMTAEFFELKWLSSQQFILHDERVFKHMQLDLIARLGKFWKGEKDESNSDASPPVYLAQFSADAVCQLTPGDKYKVVEIKPGKFP